MRFPILAALVVLVSPALAAVEYLDSYKGLPDYDQNTPFTSHDPASVKALQDLVASMKPSARSCVGSSVKVWADWTLQLHSNVCDRQAVGTLRQLVGALAPTLNRARLAFRLTSLDSTGLPALLVQYVHLTFDQVAPYPFLSIWRIRFENGSYRPVYAGPFLNGEVQDIREFGDLPGRRTVFIRHVSCIECEPTTYLTPIDFDAAGDAHPYEFTYSKAHDGFDTTIEYELPGEGHTIDAKVETRTLPPSASGPHLLQFYHMTDRAQPDEWWSFTCKSYKCDYKLDKKSPSPAFMRLWGQAQKL